MNQQTTPNITLFDLLARNWQRPAPVRHIRFNEDDTALAIVAADGTVAFARMADNEPPESRIVADGGQTGIRPRVGRPSPLIITRMKGTVSTCPAADGGFLAANEKGRLIRLSRAGETADTIFAGDKPVTAFDRCRETGDVAIVAGSHIFLHDDEAASGAPGTDLGDFTPTLAALSPDGAELALAGEGRLEIRLRNRLDLKISIALKSDPICLAWHADGRWLAVGMETGGMLLVDNHAGRSSALDAFPGPVRAVGFSSTANALVASGAFRIAGWSLDEPPMEAASTGARITGRTGVAIVEAVAIQPQGDLVAAGFANGQVTVARLGSPEDLVLRAAGGPVTCLAWTRDGQHLAVGDALGNAAIVTFPRQLFK